MATKLQIALAQVSAIKDFSDRGDVVGAEQARRTLNTIGQATKVVYSKARKRWEFAYVPTIERALEAAGLSTRF